MRHVGCMGFELSALLLSGGLFVAMFAMLELGHRLGVRRRRIDAEGAAAGTGVVEGAVFALLGLLIAFTFSGAASRFDERRKLVVEEANAIGTAYLRLDLLPSAAQLDLRASFRRYLDARLAVYRDLGRRRRKGSARPRIGTAAGDLVQVHCGRGGVASIDDVAAAGPQRHVRYHDHAHDGAAPWLARCT